MKIVEDAVAELIPHLKHEDGFSWSKEPRQSGDINLRLDWEYVECFHDISDDNIFNLIQKDLNFDLNDLIEYGDTDSDDPFWKYMDGSAKRGKEPESVDITAANLYKNFHKTKQTMEYTLYIILRVKWPE